MRPLWIILILLAVNAATIGAMLLVRRRAPEGSYTTYDQSRSGGEAEALTVIQQFETAELLPPAVRDRTSGEIVCYGRSVVHQECPQMQDGKGGDTINPWSIALFRSLQRRRPVHAMGRRVRARRDRARRLLRQALPTRVQAGVRRLGGHQATEEPQRPASPFALPQYKLAANATADRLEVKAAASSQRAGAFIQRADDYSLAVVLFASALFFAGISTRLRSSTTRIVVLGMGCALFLGSVIWIATFPVSLSV